MIRRSVFEAAPVGGVLHYGATGGAAAALPDIADVDLVRSVLQNFHYTSLQIILEGDLEQLGADIHLAGANPDVYDGHPIEFNLHIDYPPRSFLRSLGLFTELSSGLAERLNSGGSQ